MAFLWCLAGFIFLGLSGFFNLKNDKEWGYRFNVLGLLNWIVYYLAVGNHQ